jgi:hypothetical protein
MKFSKLVQTVDIKNIEKIMVVHTASGFVSENLAAYPVCRLPHILVRIAGLYLAICIRKKFNTRIGYPNSIRGREVTM